MVKMVKFTLTPTAPRVHRHHARLYAGQVALALGHHRGLEGGVAVAGHVDGDLAGARAHHLARVAVAPVRPVLGTLVVVRVAQVGLELGLEHRLDHRPEHRAQGLLRLLGGLRRELLHDGGRHALGGGVALLPPGHGRLQSAAGHAAAIVAWPAPCAGDDRLRRRCPLRGLTQTILQTLHNRKFVPGNRFSGPKSEFGSE